MEDSHSVSARRSELLKQALAGDSAALAELLHSLRGHLRRLGQTRRDKLLRRKLGTSDVLQEAELQVLKDFENFRGQRLGEFIVWFREILKTKRAKALRRFHAQKRDMTSEQNFELQLEHSGQALVQLIEDNNQSPVDGAIRREQELLVSDAIDALPEDLREIVELRHLQGLSWLEIGQRVGKSANAVQKRWPMALVKLRSLIKEAM